MTKVIYNIYISEDCPEWLLPMGEEIKKMTGFSFGEQDELEAFRKKCRKFLRKNQIDKKIFLTVTGEGEKGYITIHSLNKWNNDMIRICYLNVQGKILFSDRGFHIYQHRFLPVD